jgi:iron complex transport system substrate-binding protein
MNNRLVTFSRARNWARAAFIFGFTFLLSFGNYCAQSAISSTINISASAIPLQIVASGETTKYHRIVALANGSAEIVAALGFKDDLVGRDVASTFPLIAKVPIDNPAHETSPELIESQKPDLVIIDAATSPASAITAIKAAGIKVVLINDAFSLSDVLAKEKAIADLLGTPKAYQLLAKQISNQKFPQSNIRVAFLYLRGSAAIYLMGGKGSGADSLLAKCGDLDVGAKYLNTPFTPINSESLVIAKPTVFLLMTKGLQSVGGISGLKSLPGIAQTPAGITGRVVTVDDSLLLSFGPRTAGLLDKLCPAIVSVVNAQ